MKSFFVIMGGWLLSLVVMVLLCPHGAALAQDSATHTLPVIGIGGLIVNSGTLQALYKSYKVLFQDAFNGVTPLWMRVASLVPSTGKEQGYPWLGQLSSMREWVGDRIIQQLVLHDYAIKNKKYENTVGVKGDDIKDDQLGIYNPLFQEMGRSTAAHPDETVFAALKLGFSRACYDGQYFFDTDHPVGDQSVSNMQSGSGPAWFLLDTSRAVKPLIFQQRETPEFNALDNPNDPNVFFRDEYVYGVKCRDNVGFGMWQMAFGSTAPLNAENYAAARAAMGSLTNDHGRPLGINPNLLVFPPALEGAARKLLVNDRNDAGATNEWAGTAEPLKVAWLA